MPQLVIVQAIGILTEDFRLYYDLIKMLKQRDIPFLSLSFKDPIPDDVGVVLTSWGEMDKVDFQYKIGVDDKDLEQALALAIRKLGHKDVYDKIVVGIDPGKAPGLVVFGDEKLLVQRVVKSPEDVKVVIIGILANYPSKDFVVKIGHGDIINRNRIINTLAELDLNIFIVDETNTTTSVHDPDIYAAMDIARGEGYAAQKMYDLEVTDGLLHDIKRRSRLMSDGNVTISTELARQVALGKMSMLQAIEEQRAKSNII